MYKNLIFPKNLDQTHSAFIVLIGQKWGTKYREDKTAKFQTQNDYISIALPMPTNGLSDSTTHNWEGSEGALLNPALKNVTKLVMKGLLDKIKASIGNMAAAQQFKSGRTINDYAAMTYGGQEFREFSFDFELIPNNETDAIIINDIIKLLKIGSLPKKLGAMIKYPFFWTVKAVNPMGKKYFSMDKCVINSLSINKFTGEALIHADGEPIQTNISVSFTELNKEWSNEYEKDYEKYLKE